MAGQVVVEQGTGTGTGTRWVGGVGGAGTRVVALLAAAQALLAAADAADWALGRPFWRMTSLVDLEQESSLGTWLQSIILLAGGLTLAVVVAATVRVDRRAWPLVVIPTTLVTLSVDEVVQMHEWAGRVLERALGGDAGTGPLADTGPWVLLAVPFAVVVGVVLWHTRPYLRSSPKADRLLIGGFGVYVVGAAGVELLRDLVVEGSFGHLAQVVVEEGLEGAGAIVVLWGGIVLLEQVSLRIAVGPLTPVRPGGPGRPPTAAGARPTV